VAVNPPRISIITVTYQAEAVLPLTLASVAEQNYPHLEHLLIDGASTDQTGSLITAYQPSYPVVRLSEPDRGLYDAMNKGLHLATGDYVLFLNAGDTLADPQVLSEIMAAAKGADVIYGHAQVVNAQQKPLGLRLPLPPAHLTWRSLQWGMSVCHQAFIIKREKAVHYDLQYRICADIDWMIRSLKQCETTYFTDGVVCQFMADGLSSQHRKKAWKERFQVLAKHFGRLANLINHAWIVLRYPFHTNSYR
jgi:glycosyltransferase involved in cell wall biosynthesis